jgi:3-mercaptopyruvate sulfurtransferase SseA
MELAAYPKFKVFVRGWEQWSADPDAPVETDK